MREGGRRGREEGGREGRRKDGWMDEWMVDGCHTPGFEHKGSSHEPMNADST